MQVDDQIAVSSAAVEAPVATPEPAAPRELTEEETRAYLTRKDRSQSVEDVIKPSEAKSDTADKSEAPKEEAKQPEADAGKQPGRGIDKRIKELRELLAATKEARAARRAEPEPAQAAQPVKQPPDGLRAPKLADFDDFDAYETARDAYTEKLADAKATERLKAWQDEQTAKQAQSEWNERATKAGVNPQQLTEAATTYAALVEAGEMPAFSQAMVEALNDPTTEAGPAVALHLIENPSEVQRIAGLSPVAQVRELDRLAATLRGEAPAKQAPAVTVGRVVPKVSAASAPVPELGSGNASDPLADAVAANDFAAYAAAKRRKAG